jgi:hypothetical protein
MVADVQFADEPDGVNFFGNSARRFRSSLNIGLLTAVDAWKGRGVRTVVQLGDFLDGIAKNKSSDEAVKQGLSDIPLFKVV